MMHKGFGLLTAMCSYSRKVVSLNWSPLERLSHGKENTMRIRER
jgi:hypothetical protein